MKILAVICGVMAGLVALAAAPAAGQCSSFSISSTPMAFGTYNPLDSTSTNTSGTIAVSCSGEVGLEATYSISISPGASNGFHSRTMVRGNRELAYNLFAGYLNGLIWGDGTGGTHTVTDLVPLLSLTEYREYDVSGSIFPEQQVPSGTYSDSVIVTVSF